MINLYESMRPGWDWITIPWSAIELTNNCATRTWYTHTTIYDCCMNVKHYCLQPYACPWRWCSFFNKGHNSVNIHSYFKRAITQVIFTEFLQKGHNLGNIYRIPSKVNQILMDSKGFVGTTSRDRLIIWYIYTDIIVHIFDNFPILSTIWLHVKPRPLYNSDILYQCQVRSK